MYVEYKPYTYLLGWSSLNVYYYGVEYGQKTKVANPQNLWTSYFTSSKQVKQFRELHGEPDLVEVRKVFDDPKKGVEWENKVLRRMNVLQKPDKWLNRNIAGVVVMNEDTASKISSTTKGRMPKVPRWKQPRRPESRAASSTRMKFNNPSKTGEGRQNQSRIMKSKPGLFTGKQHSEETRKAWSEKRKGVKRSKESIEKQKITNKGKRWIHKDNLNIKVSVDQLNHYLINGWSSGMSKRS